MRLSSSLFRFSLFVLPFSLICGCTLLGVAAYKLTPPKTIQPRYLALNNQSIGVMIWADRGIRIDWSTVQLDIANRVQEKLKDSQAKKKKTLPGATFPVLPASIVRYQKDHPEIEALPIADIAPRLGVSRLIYVEMEDFATRSDQSIDLYRGVARANVKVFEIEGDQAKLAFEQQNVQAVFPAKGPREGIPGAGDARTYVGVVDAFATEVAHLFVAYQEEE
jgi:hypothetical protein